MARLLGMGSVVEAYAEDARPLHRAQQAHLCVIVNVVRGLDLLEGQALQAPPLGGGNFLAIVNVCADSIAPDDHGVSLGGGGMGFQAHDGGSVNPCVICASSSGPSKASARHDRLRGWPPGSTRRA